MHAALQLPRHSVFAAFVFHAAANIAVSTFDVPRSARTLTHVLTSLAALAGLFWWARRNHPLDLDAT